jgi:uncharacterized protein YecT (DUF1311 family)
VGSPWLEQNQSQKMKCTFIALAILVALLPSPSVAEAKAADPGATQANTIEINQCLSNQLKARDRSLNAAYKALLQRLDESDPTDGVDYARARRLLVEAQRAWISFRDNDCSGRVVLYERGSIRGELYTGCLIAHTERCSNELRRWMTTN